MATTPLNTTLTREQILGDIQEAEQTLELALAKLKALTEDTEVAAFLRASHQAIVQARSRRLVRLHAQLELGLHA